MCKMHVFLCDTCPTGAQMSTGIHSKEEQCASLWIVFPFYLLFPKMIFYRKGLSSERNVNI